MSMSSYQDLVNGQKPWKICGNFIEISSSRELFDKPISVSTEKPIMQKYRESSFLMKGKKKCIESKVIYYHNNYECKMLHS